MKNSGRIDSKTPWTLIFDISKCVEAYGLRLYRERKNNGVVCLCFSSGNWKFYPDRKSPPTRNKGTVSTYGEFYVDKMDVLGCVRFVRELVHELLMEISGEE